MRINKKIIAVMLIVGLIIGICLSFGLFNFKVNEPNLIEMDFASKSIVEIWSFVSLVTLCFGCIISGGLIMIYMIILFLWDLWDISHPANLREKNLEEKSEEVVDRNKPV